MAAWESWVAGLVPLIVVWGLWRLQTLSVEALRRALWVLREGHKALYHVVSWFGTLLHEVSHATVLLLSGHGIKQFRAGSEQGHVLPARMAKGPVGFLFFLAAALAPLFIPPLLVLVALAFLEPGLVSFVPGAQGLMGSLDVVRRQALALPWGVLQAMLALDLTDWRHAGVLALALLGIPGARPSHVKGSRFHGTRDEGDVAVLRRMVRHNPWPLLVFLLLLYGAYVALVLLAPALGQWYWVPFQAVTGVAVTGILLAALCSLLWGAVGVAGLAGRGLGFLAIAAAVAAEVAGILLGWAPALRNTAALAALLAVALAFGLVALARRRRMPV